MNEIEEKLLNIDLDYYYSLKKLLDKKDVDVTFSETDKEIFKNFRELVDRKISGLEDGLYKAQDDLSNEASVMLNYIDTF